MSDEHNQADSTKAIVADACNATKVSGENIEQVPNSEKVIDSSGNNESQSNEKNENNNSQKKSNKWKFNKNQKNKKKPWHRTREDNKRQKINDGEGGSNNDHENDDGNERPKNHRRNDDFDTANATPHEGSFAHPSMQKLFNVQIEQSQVETGKDEENAGEGDGKDMDGETNNDVTDAASKQPKRKLALLVSFLGTNYCGFQINGSKNTLQAQLELGLYRAGIISYANFGYPSKYSWSNSARTDKGVHAAAQVCSVKGHMISGDQLDVMREKANEHLPDDIRVIDIERVTRNFCARTNR